MCHLVYLAEATIIYPLCETNVYILSPHADTQATSLLVEDFVRQFPGRSLPVELAELSFPTQLRETQNILLQLEKQDLKVQMVLWMLHRHLLVQLHTYVFFVPPVPRRKKKVSEEWNISNHMSISKQSRPWLGSSYKSCLIWVCSVCKSIKRRLYEENG